MEKAIKQIELIEQKGDKCLKTGFFRWKKDYVGAAGNYDTAASKYKRIGEYERVSPNF